MSVIAIGSDHAGKELRAVLINRLEGDGHKILDLGTHHETANYAIKGIKVGENVASGIASRGIVICGTGIGISIAANKVRGIRCALCHSAEYAKLTRLHNDANILALGARFLSVDEAYEIATTFLNTEFEGGRHEDRVHTIDDYENSCVDCN